MMYNALGYQYLEAWYHILHLIALLFQVVTTFIFSSFLFFYSLFVIFIMCIYIKVNVFFIIDSWKTKK